MSDTRRNALKYLESIFGEVPNGIICTSKLYEPEKSWTRSPAYWIEIPLIKLNNPIYNDIHILCRKHNNSFYHLLVPRRFIIDNRDKLSVIKGERISLFLSARSEDMFMNLRGKGKLDFSRWLQS